MTAPDLKPCPFCGSEARMWQDPSHSAAWFIGCDDGETACFGAIHWDQTKAEAIAAWNTRPTPLDKALAVPEVKALVDALQKLIQQTHDCEKELTEELHHTDFCGESEPLAKARAALRAIGEGKA